MHEFVESESAGETGRRKFREMLNSIEADPSISAILVWKVDRLFRNLKDRVTIDDLIRSKNLSAPSIRRQGDFKTYEAE